MGVFSGIGDAKISAGGVYFEAPGNYVVKIRATKLVRSRNNEDLYTAECDIKESDHRDRKAGTQASWQCNAKHDSFKGNVKAYLAACNGVDPNDEAAVKALFKDSKDAEDAAEFSVSSDNPTAGTWLNLSCVKTETRKKTPFTVHKWSPYPRPGQALHPEYVEEQKTKA